MGHVYIDMQRFSEGESMYEESIKTRRHCLAENYPQAYKPGWAIVLEHLAERYENSGRYSECAVLYKEALEIYNRLAIEDPDRYNFEALVTRNKLREICSTHHITLEEDGGKETSGINKVWNWITRKNK